MSVVEFKNTNDLKNGLKFDKNICSACIYNIIKNKIDWEKRESDLRKVLDRYRKKTGYDCVDSSNNLPP